MEDPHADLVPETGAGGDGVSRAGEVTKALLATALVLMLSAPSHSTELPLPDLRRPHICGVAGGSCRELVMQMSQEAYDRWRHQQYFRQKQREFRRSPGRYQQWLEHYKQIEANPALATRRRCAPGFVC